MHACMPDINVSVLVKQKKIKMGKHFEMERSKRVGEKTKRRGASNWTPENLLRNEDKITILFLYSTLGHPTTFAYYILEY